MRGMSAVLLAPRKGACAHGHPTLLTSSPSALVYYTLCRTWASIHVGRRARALERYITGPPIVLELPMQRSATGAAVGGP